jgi:hypothetical protein
MKNSQCVIHLDTEGSHRTIVKAGDHWVMTVASSSKAYEMTAEQLLSHLLPALMDHRAEITVTKRA